MLKRTKLWTSISAITLAGAALSACSQNEQAEGEGEAAKSQLEAPLQAGEGEGETATINQGEGEGETGEGEGEGEGEGSGQLDFASNDLAYLTHLALMRGHLFVGHELYQAGHKEHAKTHMKHPESELYADVVTAFEARQVAGFANQLSALSQAVEADAGSESVANAYAQLVSAISASELAVSSSELTPSFTLKRAVQLLRTAGDEYAIAVVDGKMENAHEYQDAFGFTTIARTILEGMDESTTETKQAKQAALEHVANLKPLWPSIVPPQELSTAADALYGAAARLELLALGVE